MGNKASYDKLYILRYFSLRIAVSVSQTGEAFEGTQLIHAGLFFSFSFYKILLYCIHIILDYATPKISKNIS